MTMHFLTFVFIPKDTDIQTAVVDALWPFGNEFPVKPWKGYLTPQEIALMARHYRLRSTDLGMLASRMEDWNGDEGDVDARGLFAIHTYNPDMKWDWYEIGGRWNGLLPGNVLSAQAFLRSPKFKQRLPHDFLTPDGEWHEVETFRRDGARGGTFLRKPERHWLSEFKTALEAFPDHRVVAVDRHS